MVRIAAAAAAAMVAALLGALVAWPATSAPPTGRYGQLPSWLPKAKIPVGRIVNASAVHPWLAIQGDAVSVHLARARVLVTAVGSAVPNEGQFPVPKTTPCTFTVTLTAASGPIPLNPRAFTIVDQLGRLHHPQVSTTGGGPPPISVLPGQTVSLTVNEILPTGDGRLRWAPDEEAPIVSWDFNVEVD